MFAFIDNVTQTVLIAVVFVIAIIGVIQYSRYEAHRKDHIGDPVESHSYRLATKFSAVPYLIVPVLFGAVSIISALFLQDIFAGRGYIAAGEITYFTVAQSVVLYLITDKVIVRQAGNAVYFDSVEDKIFQHTINVAEKAVNIDTRGDIVTISREEYEKIMRK